MDYPWAEFGNFGFSRFGFIVRTDTQNYLLTEVHQCYTHASTVGVSNNVSLCVSVEVDDSTYMYNTTTIMLMSPLSNLYLLLQIMQQQQKKYATHKTDTKAC